MWLDKDFKLAMIKRINKLRNAVHRQNKNLTEIKTFVKSWQKPFHTALCLVWAVISQIVRIKTCISINLAKDALF